jgi:glutathione synthase
MKRFAFVMDPLEKLSLPWDTSLCLLRELARQGHKTFLFTPASLSWEKGPVQGKGREIIPLGDDRYRQGPFTKLRLADFHAVLIRKDPPFDSSYLALTYLLEPLAQKTRVINHPQGIRRANEKLFGLNFPRWSPLTLVSSDPGQILVFQKRIDSDLVIKPLYEKGGKGVFLLKRTGRNRLPLLRRATRQKTEPVVAQKFIPVRKGGGDKRILLWKGKILGAFNRIPKPGEFRTNLSLGADFAPAEISAQEKRLVRSLRPALLKEGLLFVGIDVRAGKLIEVNVTSPAGLVELDQLYGPGFTEKVAKDLAR